MPTTSIRRIFVIAGVISLFISYVGIWIRFINDPVERTGADFIAAYSAGRVAQSKGSANAYNPELQQQIQQEQVGFPLAPGQVMLYNHLPFLLPVLQLIASPDYVASFYRWFILHSLLYLIGIAILSQTLKQAGLDRNSIILSAVGTALFLPVFFSLMNGQDTSLLLLGAALWAYGSLSDKDYLAGFGLSLTTVRPHIALLLAIPMLFRYRKVFLGFLMGSGLLALESLFVLGPSGIKDYLNVLFVSVGGNWFSMKEDAMPNLIGLLTRGVPQLGADNIRIVGWVFYGITLLVLCILCFQTSDYKNRYIGLSVTLAVFAVPHIHFHDLTLLLIPIYELIRGNRETGYFKTPNVILLPIVISLLFLVSNASYYLQYTTPYLIMLVLALYPFYEKQKFPTHEPGAVSR
jgi:hypothetical protein